MMSEVKWWGGGVGDVTEGDHKQHIGAISIFSTLSA